MKRLFFTVFVLSVFLAVSVLSFAAEGRLGNIKAEIPVTASVGKYAEILVGDTAVNLTLMGAAGEVARDDDNIFTVESNCLVDLSFKADALTNGRDFIAVDYELFKEGNPDALLSYRTERENGDDVVIRNIQDYVDGVVRYNIAVAATLGNISDQSAGEYSSTIYLTVAAAE